MLFVTCLIVVSNFRFPDLFFIVIAIQVYKFFRVVPPSTVVQLFFQEH